MTKKVAKNKVASNSVASGTIQQGTTKNWMDRLAAWIGRRSRLIRFVLAGSVSLVLTASIAMIIDAFFLSLEPGSGLFVIFDQPVTPFAVMLILSLTGLALYAVGAWLFACFEVSNDSRVLERDPGRPAAIWLVTGVSVLFVAIILIVWAVVDLSN